MTDNDNWLVYIQRRLAEHYPPEAMEIWLNSKHIQLGGKRPIDLIEKGRGAEVKAILDRLDSGAYL